MILIDGCSGIQVGEDNDQVSVYTVKLPAEFASARELAELLLSEGAPWARDVFSHDAVLRPPAAPNRPAADFSGTVAGPSGTAHVLVRNSSGVQVGDHNIQRNTFRIVAAPVSVAAGSVAVTSARSRAISSLDEDPSDRAAARRLAQDLANAAQATVLADITARLQADIGTPRIHGYPHKLTGVTGRQIGTHGTARVKLEVTTTKFDASALAAEISTVARGLAALRATTSADDPLAAPAVTARPAAASPLSSLF